MPSPHYLLFLTRAMPTSPSASPSYMSHARPLRSLRDRRCRGIHRMHPLRHRLVCAQVHTKHCSCLTPGSLLAQNTKSPSSDHVTDQTKDELSWCHLLFRMIISESLYHYREFRKNYTLIRRIQSYPRQLTLASRSPILGGSPRSRLPQRSI